MSFQPAKKTSFRHRKYILQMQMKYVKNMPLECKRFAEPAGSPIEDAVNVYLILFRYFKITFSLYASS